MQTFTIANPFELSNLCQHGRWMLSDDDDGKSESDKNMYSLVSVTVNTVKWTGSKYDNHSSPNPVNSMVCHIKIPVVSLYVHAKYVFLSI